MAGQGLKSKDRYRDLVADALCRIDDPSSLRTNPLCRIGAIEDMAKRRYTGSPLSKARALRDVLLVCCERESAEAKDPFKTFLELYKQGKPIAKIARKMGRSREHCSRVYRRLAVDLVSDEFQVFVEVHDLTNASRAVC